MSHSPFSDLGNLSVYRHDNGADPYELFDFLITQQEVNHIFDNYRRGRSTFSVRGAADRSLHRYNTKLRDAAKGLGLMTNIYRDFAQEVGYDFNGLWPVIGSEFFAGRQTIAKAAATAATSTTATMPAMIRADLVMRSPVFIVWVVF